MIRFLPVAVLALFAAAAWAQQPTPAAAATPVVPHGCQKPGEHPGRLASDNQRRNWVKDANGYLECLKKYVGDQQSAYNALFEKAKPHLDAANATIDEYNKAAATFKSAQEATN